MWVLLVFLTSFRIGVHALWPACPLDSLAIDWQPIVTALECGGPVYNDLPQPKPIPPPPRPLPPPPRPLPPIDPAPMDLPCQMNLGSSCQPVIEDVFCNQGPEKPVPLPSRPLPKPPTQEVVHQTTTPCQELPSLGCQPTVEPVLCSEQEEPHLEPSTTVVHWPAPKPDPEPVPLPATSCGLESLAACQPVLNAVHRLKRKEERPQALAPVESLSCRHKRWRDGTLWLDECVVRQKVSKSINF